MLTTLLKQHGTLYDAATRLPRVAELQGRSVAVVAEFGGAAWAVRHYRRGGAVMRVLGDRYLRLGVPRALRELQVSAAARARGIATPEIKAAVWYSRGVFRRADVATVYLAQSHDLAAILFENGAEQASSVEQAATLIRTFVQHGLLHRDLNLKNILITPGGAYVLDLDRCAVVERLTAAQVGAMRERLFRSLAKWERQTMITVAQPIKQRLHDAFHA